MSSIDGIENGVVDGRSVDWFFYVDGVESPIGAAEVEVEAGSRIWWDHHDWTDVMRVPAVVGSWPAPFAGGEPVAISCADPAADACAEATERIEAAGGEVAEDGAGGAGGPTRRRGALGGDRATSRRWPRWPGRRPAAGSSRASRRAAADWSSSAYDQALGEADRLGPGGGIVAALEGSGEEPTWVVSGTDAAGAEAAAAALDEAALANRFAVAVPPGGEPTRLPQP